MLQAWRQRPAEGWSQCSPVNAPCDHFGLMHPSLIVHAACVLVHASHHVRAAVTHLECSHSLHRALHQIAELIDLPSLIIQSQWCWTMLLDRRQLALTNGLAATSAGLSCFKHACFVCTRHVHAAVTHLECSHSLHRALHQVAKLIDFPSLIIQSQWCGSLLLSHRSST